MCGQYSSVPPALVHSAFPFPLGKAISVDGVRLIVFSIRRTLLAIEDLIAAYVEHDSVYLGTAEGDMAAAFGVYAMRAVGVGFTADGIGPGGGVDDQPRRASATVRRTELASLTFSSR